MGIDLIEKMLRNWTDTEIIADLQGQNHIGDADLFKKFLKVGYKGLKGGNVVCRDTDRNSNEYARVARIVKEYGQLAPDIWYFFDISEAEFREGVK